MSLSALAGLMILSASLAHAQSRQFALRPSAAPVQHEFAHVGSVRELADGRLLVTDTGDDELLVVDVRSGAVLSIAAKGAGPGEFRDLGRLIALGGDTTIMADGSNRRALILHRDRVVATLATDDILLTVVGTDLVGADSRGNLVGLRRLSPADFAATPRRDPVALVSFNRRTMKADTIALLRAVEVHTKAAGLPPRQTLTTSTAIMSSPEQAAVFADGEIAVALQDPYRVEWHSVDGKVRQAAPIERVALPVDDAEKLAWKRRQEEWSGRPLDFSLDRFPWAATVPPFRQGALTTLSDGTLLVAREPWSGNPANVYDVVDRTGNRVGTLQLPARSRVVGSGRSSVFVAVADDDGIESLHRHAWP